MNEGIVTSSDYKVGKDGRRYPAKRFHMGEKEQVTEASYKGNIGVMELAKFHSSASAEDKAKFTDLMKKKSSAKSEKEQRQMASQIWDHVQKVTGTKLHQMENTMFSFKDLLEDKNDYILQTLANRDINASMKDGKILIHDHSQHRKAQTIVRRLGVNHEVVKAPIKEELEESHKIGDSVHIGIGQKAGAGMTGKLLKVDGQWAHIESFHKVPGLDGKMKPVVYKGLVRNMSAWDPAKAIQEGMEDINESGEDPNSKYMWKIEGGKGKGKFFGHKDTTVSDHLSAMEYHAVEAHKANKEKRYDDGRHHGMKYHKHKDQIEALGSRGDYMKDSVEVDHTATTVLEAMPTHEFNKLVRGYLNHKKAAKKGGFKPLSMDQYKRTSVKALATAPIKEETIKESTNHSVGDVIHIHHHSIAGKDYHGSTNIDKVSANYIEARHPETNEMIKFRTKTRTQTGSVAGSRAGAYVFSTSKNEETIEELSKETLDSYSKKAEGHAKPGRDWQRLSGLLRAQMKKQAKTEVKEEKKLVVPTLKPRDPNYKILAMKKNAAGSHRDKKKEMKQGNDKHKGRVFEDTQDE